MFSILIPTYNNLNYLKNCIKSLEKNSKIENQIIVHINDGSEGSLDFIKQKKIEYTHSDTNIGLCSAINIAFQKANYEYVLYSHDDMYFCPDWDIHLKNEISKTKNNKFYISGTMIEPNSGHIQFDCGTDIESFDEAKLLKNLPSLNFYDHQGTHFAPHVVHKDMWNQVGGFSEEFNPGICSDPDFNMKLWKAGVRIFKGLNNFRVYHFSSITTRKKNNLLQNKGDVTFLKKWGITSKFFKKHYLKSKTKYLGPLKEPEKNTSFFLDLLICKINLIYQKITK